MPRASSNYYLLFVAFNFLHFYVDLICDGDCAYNKSSKVGLLDSFILSVHMILIMPGSGIRDFLSHVHTHVC